MAKISVLVSGGGTNLQALIDKVQDGSLKNAEIVQVIASREGVFALERAAKADKALLFYENEQATTLKMALSDGAYTSVSLLTGPEGGLEPSEVTKAEAAGLRVCTLGKRILRCETAPLCALSAVMYDAGEF